MTGQSEFQASKNRQELVLLVEHHPLIRDLMEHILHAQLGLKKFVYAASGDEAIRVAAKLRPQLMLIDFSLPDMNGLEVARHVLRRAPGTRVALLIEEPETEYQTAAEASGVAACIAKATLWDDLPVAVTRLLAEGTSQSPTTQRLEDG